MKVDLARYMPAPLGEGKLCKACNGTGADDRKTQARAKIGGLDKGSYVRCWECNGGGLDPAEYFRWGDHK